MAVQMEKTKQRCGCMPGVVSLSPVKSERTTMMFEEATSFSKRLKNAQKQIVTLKKATEGMMNITDKTLAASNYPKVYDRDAASGRIVPVPEADEVAPTVSPGALLNSPDLKMKTEVLDPIAAWQSEYTRAKGRMAELDRLRVDLDAKRRRFYKEMQKHLKTQRKTDNTSIPAPVEENDPQLMEARGRYNHTEEAVYQELVQLVRKTKQVHVYLTRAMQLESEALAESANEIQDSPVPQSPAPQLQQAPLSNKFAGSQMPSYPNTPGISPPNTPAQSVVNGAQPAGRAPTAGYRSVVPYDEPEYPEVPQMRTAGQGKHFAPEPAPLATAV